MQTASQAVSYAVTAPLRSALRPAVPRLRALRLTPRAFIAATRGPTISTRSDAGALIRYVDTLAAHSTFTGLRCARSHGRCGKLARAYARHEPDALEFGDEQDAPTVAPVPLSPRRGPCSWFRNRL
jgi:hypothetical protein